MSDGTREHYFHVLFGQTLIYSACRHRKGEQCLEVLEPATRTRVVATPHIETLKRSGFRIVAGLHNPKRAAAERAAKFKGEIAKRNAAIELLTAKSDYFAGVIEAEDAALKLRATSYSDDAFVQKIDGLRGHVRILRRQPGPAESRAAISSARAVWAECCSMPPANVKDEGLIAELARALDHALASIHGALSVIHPQRLRQK